MVAHFMNALYAAAGSNETAIEHVEAELAKKLEALTIPKIGAAMSDHVAAELLTAVQKLLSDAKQMREMARKPKG